MCQSLPTPSLALYWHIGETTIRFDTVNSASFIGENRALGIDAHMVFEERMEFEKRWDGVGLGSDGFAVTTQPESTSIQRACRGRFRLWITRQAPTSLVRPRQLRKPGREFRLVRRQVFTPERRVSVVRQPVRDVR